METAEKHLATLATVYTSCDARSAASRRRSSAVGRDLAGLAAAAGANRWFVGVTEMFRHVRVTV